MRGLQTMAASLVVDTGPRAQAQWLWCTGFAACGIFLDQGVNPGLLLWQANSVQLSRQRSPKILLRKFYRQGTD